MKLEHIVVAAICSAYVATFNLLNQEKLQNTTDYMGWQYIAETQDTSISVFGFVEAPVCFEFEIDS